jgi:hypothetical protein
VIVPPTLKDPRGTEQEPSPSVVSQHPIMAFETEHLAAVVAGSKNPSDLLPPVPEGVLRGAAGARFRGRPDEAWDNLLGTLARGQITSRQRARSVGEASLGRTTRPVPALGRRLGSHLS